MTAPVNMEENPSLVNPGLKFCVWPKAFDHAVQTIVDSVFQGRVLIDLYEASSEFVNVMVTNIVKPKFRIVIEQGMLTWKVDNARFTIRADEMALRTIKTFVKGVSGSFTVDIIVAPTAQLKTPSFSVRINLSCISSPSGFRLSDFDNSPSHATDDNDNVKGLEAGVKNTADIYFRVDADDPETENGKRTRSEVEPGAKRRRTDDHVESTERLINQEICNCLLQAFADMVVEKLNGSLPVYSPPREVASDAWLFDFGEMSMPEFQNGFLESKHSAAVRYGQDTIQAPTPACRFPEPQNSGRMLTVFISNCVFDAIGSGFHRHNILTYNLTQADLIAPETKDTTATNPTGETHCLSDCFPDFSEKYPGASVEVSMTSTEAPTSKFSGQSLTVKLLGSATFRARLPDGELVDILKTAVTVETVVALTLEVGRLVGDVKSVRPTAITYFESNQTSVNNEVLKKVLFLIVKQFLRKKFGEIAQKGIPLPRPLIPGVLQLKNTVLQTEENYLRVDTDLAFRA